jgi:hypothetical protein
MMNAAAPRASWETRVDTAREYLIPVNAKVIAITPTETAMAAVTTRRVRPLPARLMVVTTVVIIAVATLPIPTNRTTTSRKEPPC